MSIRCAWVEEGRMESKNHLTTLCGYEGDLVDDGKQSFNDCPFCGRKIKWM